MKKSSSSSPFIRTVQSNRTEGFTGVKCAKPSNEMAHFSNAPGGVQFEKHMNSNVQLRTSGKRWYVEYYDYNGERKRTCGYVNKYKDLSKRMDALLALRIKVYNSLFHHAQKIGEPITVSQGDYTIYSETLRMKEEKKPYCKYNAFMAIKKNLKPWEKFLINNNIHSKKVHEVSKTDILNYRNTLLLKGISNRTVNNYIDELRGLFNYIIKNRDGLLFKNPCTPIDNLPSRSEVHVAYTEAEQTKIFEYLNDNKPDVLFYVKFIAYIFFRCDEARMLQIKNLDLENNRIIQTAANNKVSVRKYKIIPKFMVQEFYERGLDKLPGDYYIFGPKGKPGARPCNKDHFSKIYRPIKKKFGFTKLHTIYGFRHTSVCQLIASGVAWYKIMKLTGHTTMESFQKYAESILAVPAEDLSEGFKVKHIAKNVAA